MFITLAKPRLGTGQMMRIRPQSIPLILAGAIYVAGATFAVAQELDSQDFERCKTIAPDRARLDCLKKLLPKALSDDDSAAIWPLIRTPRPNGGPDAVAIMRTADTAQSDPDLAGLMIRCQEKLGLEVVLALLRPFPPRSKKDVVVNLGATEAILHAETSTPGTALVLPIDATFFTIGPWRHLKQLSVEIRDSESNVRGVIPLDGIAPALAKLSASCPSG
jgi:hypothetical protein